MNDKYILSPTQYVEVQKYVQRLERSHEALLGAAKKVCKLADDASSENMLISSNAFAISDLRKAITKAEGL